MDGSGRRFEGLSVRVRDVPVVEFVRYGERVSTVNVRLGCSGLGYSLSLFVVPVTRVGRSLPDWPRALSLKPDVGERRN